MATDDLIAANKAIDPIRAAIIETCKREGIPRHTAIAALAILIGIEAGTDGVSFDEWMRPLPSPRVCGALHGRSHAGAREVKPRVRFGRVEVDGTHVLLHITVEVPPLFSHEVVVRFTEERAHKLVKEFHDAIAALGRTRLGPG